MSDDDEALARYGAELAAAVEQALPGWVVREVERLAEAATGRADLAVVDEANTAGERAAAEIVPLLRRLFAVDVDEQATNPLSILRGAVRYPTEVLRRAGVPPVVRDEFAVHAFPDDDYGLTPAAFADIDPSLQDPGVRWGAAKAHVVLSRRRQEGKR